MQPASDTSIAPYGGTVTQMIKLQNTAVGEKKLMMKCKIDYKINGAPVSANVSVDSFPEY
jgi:hypothetical protein